MIFPPPPALILSWMKRRQQKNVPYTLVLIALSQVFVSSSATFVPDASMPALFIRMSTVPNASSAWSNIDSTACSSLMSACTTTARRPNSSTLDLVASAPARSSK